MNMRRHRIHRRRRYGHMRAPGEVIKSRRWRKNNGATASIYGAVPWTGAPGNRKEDWHMEDAGWTIQWSDGTVGIGRPPFESKEAAEAFLRADEARRRR